MNGWMRICRLVGVVLILSGGSVSAESIASDKRQIFEHELPDGLVIESSKQLSDEQVGAVIRHLKVEDGIEGISLKELRIDLEAAVAAGDEELAEAISELIDQRTTETGIFLRRKMSETVMPLDEVNRSEMLDVTIKQLERIMNILDASQDSFEVDCIKVVGDEVYCRCLAESQPLLMPFKQFVAAVTFNNYLSPSAELSDENEQLFQAARDARDECVQQRKLR